MIVFEKERAISGRHCIVTGASRGIGRGIARKLVSAGAHVLACARSVDELETLREESQEAPGRLDICHCDISEPESVDAFYVHAHKTFEALDLLVNNAGFGVFGTVDEVTLADWDQVQQVNARGTFHMAQQAFRWMKGTGGGQIINISSVVGVKGYVNQVAYAAAKHAVMGITKVLAREGQQFGIRANAICPGGVATEMVSQARPDLDPTELIQVDDVVRAVTYLATEPVSCVTDLIELRRAGNTPFG